MSPKARMHVSRSLWVWWTLKPCCPAICNWVPGCNVWQNVRCITSFCTWHNTITVWLKGIWAYCQGHASTHSFDKLPLPWYDWLSARIHQPAPAACLPDCQTLRYLISAASLPGFKTKHVTINVMTRLFRNPRPCCAGARGGRVAQERGTAYQITDVDSECSLTMSVIYIQLLIKNGWLKSAMCLTLFQPLLLGLGWPASRTP